jgi:hypothetical protein
MRDDDYHPLTLEKARHALFFVNVLGFSQTKAANLLDLNVGQVSRVINRQAYAGVAPLAPAGYQTA